MALLPLVALVGSVPLAFLFGWIAIGFVLVVALAAPVIGLMMCRRAFSVGGGAGRTGAVLVGLLNVGWLVCAVLAGWALVTN